MKKIIIKELLNNKKGLIPNIADIVNSAVGIIKTVFSTFPKPIRYVVFLLLLLLIGAVLHFSLSVFGIYCDSANNPVQLQSSVFRNLDLIDEIPNPEMVGKEAIELTELGFATTSKEVTYCSRKIMYGQIITDDLSITQISTPTYFYDGRFCTDCEIVTIDVTNPDGSVLLKRHSMCVGDVFRKTKINNIFTRGICNTIACQPPPHYYYDQTLNLYVCEDETCSGITMGQTWDEKLQRAGATYLYPEGELTKKSYTSFVGITCVDIRPTLTIYGIPIFNYQFWAVLTLIIILAGFYIKYKKA